MTTRRKNLYPVFLCLFVILLNSGIAAGQAKVINAKVLGVPDGNTIIIRDFRGGKFGVRLRGIQAPDTSEELGREGRDYLSQMVLGKWVRVVNTRYDRSGEMVSTVMVKGRDVSLEMVIAGYARRFTGFAHEQPEAERRIFEAAENNAIRSKFNIWALK